MYPYYYPYNPRTQLQQYNRQLLAYAVANWQSFTDDVKGYYNRLKYPNVMTGFNRYISFYLEANYDPSSLMPVVCTGAEINAGTNNDKFASPLAIAESNIAFLSDIPSVPVKATGAEVTTGTNDDKFATPKALKDANIKAGVVPTSATVDTEQNTTSTTYTDLGTDGPSITYDPGAVAKTVLFLFGSFLGNSVVGYTTYVSYAISGATTVAASDSRALVLRPTGSNGQERVTMSAAFVQTLQPGSNTIKLKYRVEGNTGTFGNRFLIMVVLN